MCEVGRRKESGLEKQSVQDTTDVHKIMDRVNHTELSSHLMLDFDINQRRCFFIVSQIAFPQGTALYFCHVMWRWPRT